MIGHFPPSWIYGAPDCHGIDGPAFQVHSFTDSTFIIRQYKCLNFEGPFLYLLIGEHTTFLLDSGAAPTNGTPLPIRPLIDALLSEILTSRGQDAINRIVGHSHSHADHLAGDGLSPRDRPRGSLGPPWPLSRGPTAFRHGRGTLGP